MTLEQPPRMTQGLRGHMRWFLAEFLVVVAGVLAALLLQATWQRHENGQKEASYLRQLLADLNTTEQRILLADSQHAVGERAQQELVYAYQRLEPPHIDSLAIWLWETIRRAQSPVPVTGTVDALISTGDLRLIRNDSLRAAILAFNSAIHPLTASEVRTTEQTVFELKHDIAGRVDFAELQLRYYANAPTDTVRGMHALHGPRRSRFPLDAEAILNDRILYTALVDLHRAKGNLIGIRRRMLQETRRLKTHLDPHVKL